MAGSLKTCVRSLEIDVGLQGAFLSSTPGHLKGLLRSGRWPSDLQRHEVGPDGEVLHMQALGISTAGAAVGSNANARSPDGAAASETVKTTAKSRRQKRHEPAPPPAPPQPWIATLYSRGSTPQVAKQRLAAALRVPLGVLRTGPLLSTPGIAVQHVALPRGLPAGLRESGLPPYFKDGLLPGSHPFVAVGRGGTPEESGIFLKPNLGGISSQKRRKQRPWRCEGHRFSVILRGLDERQCERGEVDEALHGLSESGFINLYDASTFGRAEVRRYEIGAALWTGKWDLAARLILTANRSSEGAFSDEAVEAFRTGDLAKGIELLPDEAEGMRALALQLLLGKSSLEALQSSMSPTVWGRYLSAVSKLAWNHAVIERLTKLPRRPLPADMVFDDGDSGAARHVKHSEVKHLPFHELVMPLPRPGEPVPECLGRLTLERILRQLCPDLDAAPTSFPLEVTKLLPEARRIVAMPTDFSYDILPAANSSMVPCDLAQLGMDFPEDHPTEEGGGRRRSRSSGPGLALRLRFSLLRTETPEALIRELLRKGPADFLEGFGRRDELF